MPDGTIEVDLRLRLEKLKQDISRATDAVRGGLSKSFQFAARGGDIQRVVSGFQKMRDHSEAVSKSVSRTASGLRVIQSGKMAGFVQGARISDVSGGPKSYRSGPGAFVGPISGATLATQAMAIPAAVLRRAVPPQLYRAYNTSTAIGTFGAGRGNPFPQFMRGQNFLKPGPEDKSKFWREMSLSIGPVMNPGGLFTNMLASRQLYSGFAGTRTGAAVLGRMGMAGMGGPVTAGIVLVLNAAGFALKAFSKVVDTVANGILASYDKGFALFTQAAQQGLSRQFLSRRQAVAGVLGVQGNPNQAFMMGGVANQVAQRTGGASSALAKDAPALAQVVMNARILKLDFEAMSADLAVKLVPAINLVMGAIDTVTKVFVSLADVITQKYKPLLALGILAAASSIGFKNVAALLAMVDKGFTRGIQTPQPFARQLPASTMERMGLVIGGAVGGDRMVDLTRQIAQNTKDTYKLLAQRVPASGRGSQTYPTMARGFGVPGP